MRVNKSIGPALELGDNPTAEEVFSLLFTDSIVDKIVIYTNIKIAAVESKLQHLDSPHYKDTTKDEIKALLGIIIFCAIFKSSYEPMDSLFSPSITKRPIFLGIVTHKRCAILTRNSRFNNRDTREERDMNDRATCISEIFNDLIQNFQNVYLPGAHITIDQTPVPFRDRVMFLVYNPKKLAKYRIKIIGAADSHNAYFYNAYMYTGRGSDEAHLDEREKKFLIPTQSVLHLSKCVYETYRNITCDNWFTPLELVQELLEHRLTLVETIKKNLKSLQSFYLVKQGQFNQACMVSHEISRSYPMFPNAIQQSYFYHLCITMHLQMLQIISLK